MTIEQTVDIPADHRVVLEVPREIPAGRVTIAFIAEDAVVPAVIPEEEQRVRTMLKQYYHAAENAAADHGPLSGCIGSHPGFFGGDGVAYQRKIRNEWDD